MKLSFSLPSKSSSRPNHRPSQNFSDEYTSKDGAQSKPEYVTEFDASKALTQDKPKKIVIPPKPNEWRPEKKMRNLDLPIRSSTDDPNLRFELEAPSMAAMETDSAMSYGLNLRQTREDGDGDNVKKPDATPPVNTESLLLQKLKDDLKNLPEGQEYDDFEDVPVEGFGAALLSGYGWHEGKGIGRNAKEDVKVVQYERRAGREGLGFVSNRPSTKQQGLDGDPAPEAPSHVVMDFAEKPPKRGSTEVSVSAGKVVRIVRGRHAGVKGKVMRKLGGGDSDTPMFVLKLCRSDEEVTIGEHDVAELGSPEEENCLKKLRVLQIRGTDNDRSRYDKRHSSSSHRNREPGDGVKADRRKDHKRSREEGRGSYETKHDNGASYQPSYQREDDRRMPISWLTNDIRVRIISKDLRGGKLYLKKGKVVDVVGPTTCDISLDDTRELIQGVDQDLLETALPRRGGHVLVLNGKHKGAFGNLVDKNVEEETGVVEDSDTHALLNVRLEQIAEYIGDPSYIGY